MSAAGNGNHPPVETVVQGYCVHCRSRRQMVGAIQVCNRRGRHDLKGVCSICGKSMYRLGGWDSVAAAQDASRNGSAAETTQEPTAMAVGDDKSHTSVS